MRIKPPQSTNLQILFFLFFLSTDSSLNSHAQASEAQAAKRDALSSEKPKNLFSYSVKKPSLVLFNQKTANRLNLSAKEVHASSGDGSVFISPRVEFALGDFTYVSESQRALTDYRPASDGSISLAGSVNLTRHSSNTKKLSIKTDLLSIDLLNEKLIGSGSVKMLIGASVHTGANFSIERGGIFKLRGENGSRIKGEIHLSDM